MNYPVIHITGFSYRRQSRHTITSSTSASNNSDTLCQIPKHSIDLHSDLNSHLDVKAWDSTTDRTVRCDMNCRACRVYIAETDII
ncbi:hypothetical protein ALQ58_200026 [Pseudomonas syringae pv. apii]|nr:hypothetical protein ALQ58_200026 [Pseudomonas syringae pv. apii]